MSIFPVYLLKLDEAFQVVFPEGKEDIGHSDFWEKTVSGIVSQHFKIPQARLANLPYCQRRARVVGDRCYYGEEGTPELLALVRQAVGNRKLAFVHDDHEKRLREDVMEFRKLVKRHRPKSTMT